jgi:prolyl oligopeptidase
MKTSEIYFIKLFSALILTIYFSYSFGQKICTYPVTEKDNIIDTIWHKTVEDPYRWLEEINSDKTKEWLKGQAVIRDKYASKLAGNIAEHLSNYSYIQTKRVSKQGKYYFRYQIYQGSESASLYYQLQPEDEPRLLFNPNTLDKSAVISIDGIKFSDDNKTLALTLSKNGSDWKTIRFLDIDKRELLK